MNLLFAVVEDLTLFAVGAVRGLLLSSPRIENPERVLHPALTYTVLPATSETAPPRALVAHILQQPSAVMLQKSLQKSTVMYTSSLATPLRSAPGIVGDTMYTVLPYGSMVMVLDVDDMWAQVASGEYVGWVYVDDLEDRAAHVYPAFHIGEENLADDPATIRTRALINDEFGAGEMDLPLQAEEYVLYRLVRKEKKIMWPLVRPRTPGTWHSILKDVHKVAILSEPKAGAVMEFTLSELSEENNKGHLAYVEAVFPDGSIQISEANWPERGIYNERVLVREEWYALNPYFLVAG